MKAATSITATPAIRNPSWRSASTSGAAALYWLAAMVSTPDGFALAETDLKQRGPGEVCGVRQHGVTDFHVADLIRDRKILDLARSEARSLLEEDPDLKTEPRLRVELMRTLGHTLYLAGTA